jgi:hypothetical protein
MRAPCGTPVNLTVTAQLYATPCQLLGFYVNSTTAGTIILYDHPSSASNAITGTITPAIGWNAFPADLGQGLRAVIGGTLNVTFLIQPN